MTGFGIATGVCLLVFPITSRIIFFKQITGLISGLQGALKAQASYLQSLENRDMFGTSPTSHDDVASKQSQTRHKNNPQGKSSTNLEAEKLKTLIRALGELHGKIAAELVFAKREIAYGKLDGTELKELFKLTRDVFLPITGMSSIADIFNRVAEKRGWKTTDSGPQNDLAEKHGIEERKDKEKKQWNDIMKSFHGPFEVMTQAMDEGLQHTLYTLELVKRPKGVIPPKIPVADQTSPDVEAQGDIIRPGDKEFAKYLKRRIDKFYEQRKLTLAIWCRQKGFELDENLFNNPALPAPHIEVESENLSQHQQNQQQLYLILYVSILLDFSNNYSALYRFLLTSTKIARTFRWILSSLHRISFSS